MSLWSFPDTRILLELCYNSPNVRKANEGPMGCLRAAQRGIYLYRGSSQRGRKLRRNAKN